MKKKSGQNYDLSLVLQGHFENKKMKSVIFLFQFWPIQITQIQNYVISTSSNFQGQGY